MRQITIQCQIPATMSCKYKQICLRFSIQVLLLLFLQSAIAQTSYEKIDDWLKSNLSSLGGRAVLVIYKDGKLVYSKASNDLSKKQERIIQFVAKRKQMDEVALSEDFTLQSEQLIASCSKWLSAALVMTFVDEGKLSLTDTVGKFLPVLSEHGKGNISIWQCLSHLTGIAPGDFKESLTMIRQSPSMQEAIHSIALQPMEGLPGKTFHYSNVGLQIAAAVIEKIRGKNFESLFQERIANPCDMQHTSFGTNKTILAAGGARSTPIDYLHFLTMLLQEGKYQGCQILSKAAVIEMQKNRVANDCKLMGSPAEAGNWGYGFGEWVMDNATGDQRSAAVTSPGLFGSFPWINYEKQYAGFLFVFNINNKGRHEKYKALKTLADEAVTK